MERALQNSDSRASHTLGASPRQVQSRAVGWTCQRMATSAKGIKDNRPSPNLGNCTPVQKLLGELKECELSGKAVVEEVQALKKKLAEMECQLDGCRQKIEYRKAQIGKLEENREKGCQSLEEKRLALQREITRLYHNLGDQGEDMLKGEPGSIDAGRMLAGLKCLHQAIGLRQAITPLFGATDWGHSTAKKTLQKVISSQKPGNSLVAKPKRGATNFKVDTKTVNKQAMADAQKLVDKYVAKVSELRERINQSDQEYLRGREECEINIARLEDESKQLEIAIEETRKRIEEMKAKHQQIIAECEARKAEIDRYYREHGVAG